MKNQNSIRPLVCTCEINGAVGVVLRKDYDNASREFWLPFRKAERSRGKKIWQKQKPHILLVEPYFIFLTGSESHKKILASCLVEQATFAVHIVPRRVMEGESVDEALSYFCDPKHDALSVDNRTDWKQMIEEVGGLVKRLGEKPSELHLGYRQSFQSFGSVLNAYREGDLTFDEAVAELQQVRLR